MAQDEARTEAWLKLAEAAGGEAERDPHLDKLATMFLDLDTLEEKVFLMQVFFERLIIPRFRMIAAGSPGTVLEDLCNRLTVDDGIHHSAGMAYERVLLEDTTKREQQQLVKIANRMLPIFVDHSMWRPKARASIAGLMRERDIKMLQDDLEQGVRLARSSASTSRMSSCRRSRDVPRRRRHPTRADHRRARLGDGRARPGRGRRASRACPIRSRTASATAGSSGTRADAMKGPTPALRSSMPRTAASSA
jgi:hypothetical protein